MQLLAWYQPLFTFVAEKRIEKQDIDIRQVHTHLLTMITTGLLMWSYAFLAFFTIDHPLPAIVGFTASLVHLLSPLTYRVTKSSFVAANVLLAAGMAHQACFSFFTGGFFSNVIIWFGILPFLGAIMAGTRGAITWCVICIIGITTFMGLDLSGFVFPNVISERGHFIAQCFLTFGWIFLSASLSYAYIFLEEQLALDRQQKKESIDNLFRVLCHDIGNPLALLQMGIGQAKDASTPERRDRSLEISSRAVNSLSDLTHNVRRMYALKEGKVSVECSPMELKFALDQIHFLYQKPLAEKAVTLHYNLEDFEGVVVMVDPVSFVHQVLGNIVSNAIKFSERGQKITIALKPLGPRKLELTVKDQGIGMPQDILEKLFDAHARTSRPGTSGERGTGFGMPLMKTFVEKYGGEVKVTSLEKDKSPDNHGTTFALTLPGSIQF